jgi:hypothetical protein
MNDPLDLSQSQFLQLPPRKGMSHGFQVRLREKIHWVKELFWSDFGHKKAPGFWLETRGICF